MSDPAVHVAFVDTQMSTIHSSRKGAAEALAEQIDVRLRNHGAPPLAADERRIFESVIARDGVVHCAVGTRMTTCDVPIDRMTRIAHTINRSFSIREMPLLD